MIFDFHVHMWMPEYIPRSLRYSWAQIAAARKDPPGDPDSVLPRVTQKIADPRGEHLSAALRHLGVDAAAIMAVDYGVGAGEEAPVGIDQVLEHYARTCSRSDGSLVYFASVDPRRPDALELASKALDNWGAVGLKFYPPSGFEPGNEVCRPFYELLVERDMPAVFHTAVVAGALSSRFAWPILINDVQRDFPTLRIVLAHSGYSCWWDECVALASAHPHTYLELSLWQRKAARDWRGFKSMLYDAVRVVGSERVLFASDSMYGENWRSDAETATVERWISQVGGLADDKSGRFSAEEVEAILGGNAQRLLRRNS